MCLWFEVFFVGFLGVYDVVVVFLDIYYYIYFYLKFKVLDKISEFWVGIDYIIFDFGLNEEKN